MKLLTKNSIYFLLITSVVFLIGGCIFYEQLQKIMNEEAEEELYNAKKVLVDYINRSKALPGSMANMYNIRFQLSPSPVQEKILDTLVMDELNGELIPIKELHYGVEVSGYKYEGIVGKSMMESDDLVETISWSFVIIMVVLIIVLIAGNYIYSKLAWKPFLSLLNEIDKYDMHRHKAIASGKTNTIEFIQLQKAVNRMTERISSDYQNMRSFTENASHEIQTPLAIIKTKTELLLQDINLNEDEKKQIFEINQTAGRLSKLNQTLLMFAKIENDQFHEKEMNLLAKAIENKLELLEDLFQMKGIKIQKELSEHVKLNMNPVLMEMVISNLITNALKYSPENSEVKIILTEKCFSIENAGEKLAVESSKLFERFFKAGDNSSSTGLGLALVKQIALMNQHSIQYEYVNNKHIFKYCF